MIHSLVQLGLIASLVFGAAAANAQATLKGGGSTFAYPVYSGWFSAYQKKDISVNFEYLYVGSSEGIKLVLADAVDFGATDAVLNDEQMEAKKLLHVPTFAGAVVVTYSLPGNASLKLDGETISNIFLGKITKWNDTQIAMLNEGVNLPDTAITVIHRLDGSGTTNIFTEYLTQVSGEWKVKVGAGKSVKWPVGKGAKGNKGVVEAAKSTPGSITYAEHAAVIAASLPDAELKNQSGKFIRANPDSIRAALATANIPDDFRFSLTNAPGDQAYPIASATWLLVPEKSDDPVKSKKLVQFLKWALDEGDAVVREKNCAPLPDGLKKSVLAKLKKAIKY